MKILTKKDQAVITDIIFSVQNEAIQMAKDAIADNIDSLMNHKDALTKLTCDIAYLCGGNEAILALIEKSNEKLASIAEKLKEEKTDE